MLSLRERARNHRKAGLQELADGRAPDIEGAERAVREVLGKAQAIEDAVYGLKAVNPREKKVTDTRTPAQLLTAIREKGLEVDAAFGRLAELISAGTGVDSDTA